ncbi:MAG: hypothetical protein JRG94_18485 [Deltaproteobacteria bacterium]|nr:hypothetical protein [Deltaproteobacteria bacterium]
MSSTHSDTPGLNEPTASTLATAGLSSAERRIVRGCLFALGVLAVGTWIGVASSPYLATNYPLTLVGISPDRRPRLAVAHRGRAFAHFYGFLVQARQNIG